MEIRIKKIGIETAIARRALLAALLLGLLADLLLRALPWGINATLWCLAFVAAAIVVRRSARLPLAVALAFAMVYAWRDSPALLVLSSLAVAIAIAVAFLDRPARSSIMAFALSGLAAAASAFLGAGAALPAASRELPGPRKIWRPVQVAVVGSVLALPLLLVFAVLFSNADPLFQHTVQQILRPLEDVIQHGGTILLAAWLAGGVLVTLNWMRLGPDLGIPSPRRAGSEVLVAILLVDLLFLVFLAVQARAILGGREFVEATIGLSYAEYARRGFFELVATAAIALSALLVADWAVPAGSPKRQRLVVLGSGLAIMVFAILASAARRMALYVDVYGLTEARFYTSAFMAWLGIAVVLFAITVLRGRRDRFPITALSSAAVLLAGLVVLNPDATIVRYNAARPASFDAPYAVMLSADAVPVMLDMLPDLDPLSRCEVARTLLARAESAPPDPRTWNASRWRARNLVIAERVRLEALAGPCEPPVTPKRQG